MAPDANEAQRILLAMADLCPSEREPSTTRAIPTEWFRWLPAGAVGMFVGGRPMAGPGVDPFGLSGTLNTLMGPNEPRPMVEIDRHLGERLAAIDQLHAGERAVRVGWLWIAGRVSDGRGRNHRVFLPLLEVPARVVRPPIVGSAHLTPAGDVELTPLVSDPTLRHGLEERIELGGGALVGLGDPAIPDALLHRLGRLRAFAVDTARATGLEGLEAVRLIAAGASPEDLTRHKGLQIVAGVGVFVDRPTGGTGRRSSLRLWAEARMDRPTAFHALYLSEAPGPYLPASPAGGPVESPFVLSPVQRSAVEQSRTERVTVLSGAPGTGKSQTVTAIACDALARGERVLVATKTDATVDALVELLDRAPGPDPIIFGSNERRDALASRLAAGQVSPIPEAEVDLAERRFLEVAGRRDALLAAIEGSLRTEIAWDEDAAREAPSSTAPALAARVEPESVMAMERLARSKESGWKAWRLRRHARRQLAQLAVASGLASTGELVDAARRATEREALSVLDAQGGLTITTAWADLAQVTDEARERRARSLEAECRSPHRLNRSTLPAIAALATALRSGRAARREQLARLGDNGLTTALPLWMGTLSDIDELLPAEPGLFDLVVLDEASSIDQTLAVPALLRAKRAVVVGDPHQLRHVSFVADDQLERALHGHGADEPPTLAARLDVRRNSLFDVAAGIAPTLILDTQFRSDPHLVDFVTRRLYDGAVNVAARSPRTESRDCVDVIEVEGVRDQSGAVPTEVRQVVAELRRLHRDGERSVGVITPFRAQADALEAAILNAFHVDELTALDLRVGTAHAFQGNERDTMIASIGVGRDGDPGSWRFVEDSHLFTVLVTRARRRFLIVVSGNPPAGGLLQAYLDQADSPPGPPPPVGHASDWVLGIGADLTRGGASVVVGYPCGRHVVDLCVGDRNGFFGVECGVHPDGPEAHIERHLDLVRSGWTLLDAFSSRWADRRGQLIVELLAHCQRVAPEQ